MASPKTLQTKTWIAKLISLLAGAAYLVQSIHGAHYLDVTMDDGAYLMKGFLFVTGVYRPFQAYDPWTSQDHPLCGWLDLAL